MPKKVCGLIVLSAIHQNESRRQVGYYLEASVLPTTLVSDKSRVTNRSSDGKTSNDATAAMRIIVAVSIP